jgi:membrane-bound metal-dependent hydrolase YbcI (DUF457 family)
MLQGDSISAEIKGIFARMSPITHFLIGWGLASCAPALNRRERAMVTFASVIPDVDGLGIIAELATTNTAHPLNWWTEYHHVLGHNLGFACLATFISIVAARQKVKTGLLVFLSFHLHLLGDLAGARGPDGYQWPIPYFLPFSNSAQLTWSGQWALNAWPNVLITAGLIMLAAGFARVRGYSPVEFLSKRADAKVVAVLRKWFPMRQEGTALAPN